jgi:predicted metal-dependent peptidase
MEVTFMFRGKSRLRGMRFTSPTVSIPHNYRTYLAMLSGPSKKLRPFNFFANILSALRIEEDKDTETFSITVRGGHYLMKYSPDMVEKLSPLGAGIVIAHELGHPTLGHFSRMLLLETAYSNRPDLLVKLAAVMHVSADYALNSWLIDDVNLFTLEQLKCCVGVPTEKLSGFTAPLGSYAGIHPSDVGLPISKSMEWYIQELASRITEGKPLVNLGGGGEGEGEGEGSGSPLEGNEGTGEKSKARVSILKALENMTQEQLDRLLGVGGVPRKSMKDSIGVQIDEEGNELGSSSLAAQLDSEMSRAVSHSYSMVKGRGQLPGNLTKWLEESFTATGKISWKDLLRSITRTSKPSKSRRSMRRPRRRSIDLGIPTSDFPGRTRDPNYSIVFAIDTSASVSTRELTEIFSELDELVSSISSCSVTVVQCDTKIVKVHSLSQRSDRKVYGRGGTSFDPVFSWLAKQEGSYKEALPPKTVDLLIYATDGECPLPPTNLRFLPSRKVLWLLSSRGKIPGDNYLVPSTIYGTAAYGNYVSLKLDN